MFECQPWQLAPSGCKQGAVHKRRDCKHKTLWLILAIREGHGCSLEQRFLLPLFRRFSLFAWWFWMQSSSCSVFQEGFLSLHGVSGCGSLPVLCLRRVISLCNAVPPCFAGCPALIHRLTWLYGSPSRILEGGGCGSRCRLSQGADASLVRAPHSSSPAVWRGQPASLVQGMKLLSAHFHLLSPSVLISSSSLPNITILGLC